ncbi:MAG TPA: phosphopyruvate hydratase [Candidatus Staskawiczbacteria bacterium]|nr:phosphopyruvate hydratase [Candidatus Staskawiczbacteria bacterium]
MSKILNITATETKDSRNKPTVQVEVETENGVFTASVPSGASTGSNEALELRDADGRGVQTAVNNVNEIIAPKLKGQSVINQKEIDGLMLQLDGTENKSKLGANAILGVSMAIARAGAAAQKMPLYRHIAQLAGNNEKLFSPLPMFNIINGGAHAKNDLEIQEFMVVPQKSTMQENLILGNNIFGKLKEAVRANFGDEHLGLGDEGGFAPPIAKAEQALFLLKNATEGHENEVKFALDCAASEFYKDGKYQLEGREMTRSELLEFYKDLVERFGIISIEDPFSEDDWQGFEEFVSQMGDKITIVGDDLTTTNIKRIKDAHGKTAINAVLIKLNQIGSVSETIEAINMTKSFGWKVIVSHRSGETLDNFIADLAVGTGANWLKSGSPAKEERMVKYQRVVEIENELK